MRDAKENCEKKLPLRFHVAIVFLADLSLSSHQVSFFSHITILFSKVYNNCTIQLLYLSTSVCRVLYQILIQPCFSPMDGEDLFTNSCLEGDQMEGSVMTC